MKINQNLINRNHTPFVRSKSDIRWIVIHYVGALGDAYANTEYYKNNNVGASADFFVGFSGDIWWANDYWNYYSWHCGGGYQSSWARDGGGQYYGKCTNQNSIGIELCVRKRNTATKNATDTDWYFEDETVTSAVELTAYLMKELDVDIDHVIRHYDVNRKICPNPWVVDYQAWLAFKARVAAASGADPVELTPNPTGAKAPDPAQLTAKDLHGSEAEKIVQVAPIYQAVAEKTGMLASVGLAQFCLESGFGSTDLAVNANNMHGMKCSLSGNNWAGSTWDGVSKYTKQTAEQTSSGAVYYIMADFRKYPTIMKSVEDRAAYFIGAKNGTKLRYPGINKITDPEQQVRLIKAGGYATDVSYVDKLLSLISRFNLAQYDKPAKAQPKEEKDVMNATVEKIIQAAQSMNVTLKEDLKAGRKWTYSNTKKLSGTFAEARKSSTRRVNCARGVIWAMIEAGVFDGDPGGWYGRKDGAVIYKSTKARQAVQAAFDVRKIGNKTVKTCLKDGTIQPGDVVTYVGINHTNLYLGSNRWFDTGHAYCEASGENALFQSWIGNTVYGAYTVGCVLRPKKAVQEPKADPQKDVVMYRVQAGAFTDKSNAIRLKEAIEAKTGFACFMAEENGVIKVICGSFVQKANAEDRAYNLHGAGFEAFIKAV